MTKRRDQRLNARPSGSFPRWTSRKILIQVLVSSVLLAFFAAVAIAALHLFTPSNKRWKDLGDLQIVSEPTPTPRLATRPGSMPAAPNAVYTGTVGIGVAENSTQSAVPSPTPAPQPTVIVNETGSQSARLSAAGRKAAERERQKAERKRERLEAMYQSHLISAADYKRGQDEYQSGITKYHSVLNGNASTND
jgi:hypothetical protein